MRAYERLLKYAKVYTTSDPESGTHPSAAREFDLAHLLVEEMKSIGIEDAFVDEHCYVYGSIPAPRAARRSPHWVSSPTWTPPPTLPARTSSPSSTRTTTAATSPCPAPAWS